MKRRVDLIRARGVSLLEAVVAVLVLAISVPPTLSLLGEVAGHRADTVAVTRATFYAQGVMEQVLADACSTDDELGFDAFEDAASYVAGLKRRVERIAGSYDPFGMTHEVMIGGLEAVSIGTGCTQAKTSSMLKIVGLCCCCCC